MGSRTWVPVLLLAALLPACVKQHQLVVTGAQLAASEPALVVHGHAPVQVTDEATGAPQTEVISIDQPIGPSDDPHTLITFPSPSAATRPAPISPRSKEASPPSS